MTDAEVARAYDGVVSAGVDAPGAHANKLRADHLAARDRIRRATLILREMNLDEDLAGRMGLGWVLDILEAKDG